MIRGGTTLEKNSSSLWGTRGALTGILILTVAIWITWCARANAADGVRAIHDDPTDEGVEAGTIPTLSPAEVARLALFKVPELSPGEIGQILDRYKFVDPGNVIPSSLKNLAIVYFDTNK